MNKKIELIGKNEKLLLLLFPFPGTVFIVVEKPKFVFWAKISQVNEIAFCDCFKVWVRYECCLGDCLYAAQQTVDRLLGL